MVEFLLQRGAKGDLGDVNSKKATDLAASLGHQDVLSLLAGEKLSKKTRISAYCVIRIFKWRDRTNKARLNFVLNF